MTASAGSKPVIDLTRQVSCRASSEIVARNIQEACFIALNRVKSADKKAFFICDILPIIEPVDSADNFNAPLDVRTITVR